MAGMSIRSAKKDESKCQRTTLRAMSIANLEKPGCEVVWRHASPFGEEVLGYLPHRMSGLRPDGLVASE
jgi:hypothetical protein